MIRYRDIVGHQESTTRRVLLWRAASFVIMLGLRILADRHGWLPWPGGPVPGLSTVQAVQIVGTIWFGFWGMLASAVGLVVSDALVPTHTWAATLASLPAHLAQAWLVRSAFKRLGVDPRLRSNKDWLVWLIFGVVVSNALGGILHGEALRQLGVLSTVASRQAMLGWFIGNAVGTWFLGTLLLRFASPLIVHSPAFCS